MKIASWPGLAVLCLCSVPLHALAADEIATSTGAAAKTAGLGELRRAMNKAQDYFLDLYNTVNRNADQRLSCGDNAPTGTRLATRSCSTRAQTRATEEQARNFIGAMDNISADVAQRDAIAQQASTSAQTGGAPTAEGIAAQTKSQPLDSSVDVKSGETGGKVSQQRLEFAENLQKLLEKNPELRQRYEDFLAARQRYQQAGGRP